MQSFAKIPAILVAVSLALPIQKTDSSMNKIQEEDK